MTAADLLAHCKTFQDEHGMLVLCDVLETIFESHEQSACVEILDEDDLDDFDAASITYVTVQ